MNNCQIQWIAFLTLARKEVSRIFRIWPQTLLPPVITMSLYFTIFGQFIGSRVGDMRAVPYVQYIAPGLIMMAVINNAYMNVSSSFFGAKFSKSVEELLISPATTSVIMLGYLAGGVVRSCMIGLIVYVIALIFVHVPISHPWLMLLVVLLTSISFSLAGLFNAVFAKKFDDISIIPTFVLTPLTYLGGVFVSVHNLSPTWQLISKANPILYIVDAFRFSMLGISDINIKFAIALLIGLCAALYAMCWWLLYRGIGTRS